MSSAAFKVGPHIACTLCWPEGIVAVLNFVVKSPLLLATVSPTGLASTVTRTGASGVQPCPLNSATPTIALLTVSNWMRGGGGGVTTTGTATRVGVGDGSGGGGAAWVVRTGGGGSYVAVGSTLGATVGRLGMTFFCVVGSCISRRVVLPCPVLVDPVAGPSDPPPDADDPVDDVDPAPDADDEPDDDEPDPSEPSWAPPVGAPDNVARPATRLTANANVAN